LWISDLKSQTQDLKRTDTFATRVYPRNEFVQPDRANIARTSITASKSAKTRRPDPMKQAPPDMQGSNISRWLLQKLIWLITLACTTRMLEMLCPTDPKVRRTGSRVRTALYTRASELTSSRLSDYSLVKEPACLRRLVPRGNSTPHRPNFGSHFRYGRRAPIEGRRNTTVRSNHVNGVSWKIPGDRSRPPGLT
jgi:hypothetical protein